MTAKELRKYLGKAIRFESNRTRIWTNPQAVGVVKDVRGREVYCDGDWHDTKTFKVLEILEDDAP